MQGGNISNRLIFAVRDGRMETVRELLASYGLSYSPAWSDGYVLLRHALEKKQTAVIHLLLSYGPKVNSKSINPSTTPLHFAVINGDIDIVQSLLDSAADVNAVDRARETPLHYAAKSKNIEISELLIDYGAYVDASNSSNLTPLHLAVKFDTKEIVELLLKKYTNVHANGENGTPLHMAVQNGNVQIVELLLKYGAHVNSMCSSKYEEGTPLQFAVKRRHKEVVKLLLKSGANVDAQNKDGKTILYFAIENGCKVIIEDILKYCPDVNNNTNRSTLSAAVQKYGTQYNDIVENLLQYGFTVNPEDANDYNLLHAAVEKGYLTIVEQFLKYSSDVNLLYNSTSRKYYMPLHTAAKNKQEKVAELLITQYNSHLDL